MSNGHNAPLEKERRKFHGEILSKKRYETGNGTGIYEVRETLSGGSFSGVMSLRLPHLHPGEEISCAVAEGLWTDRKTNTLEKTLRPTERPLIHPPSSRDGVKNFLESGFAKGLGNSTAKRLFDKWGEKTPDVFTKTVSEIESCLRKVFPESCFASLPFDEAEKFIQELSCSRKGEEILSGFLSVRGMGASMTASCLHSWAKILSRNCLNALFASCGVSDGTALKIESYWGEQNLERLKQNPYSLMEAAPFLPFSIPDALADVLHIPGEDERRKKATLLFEFSRASAASRSEFLPLEFLENEMKERFVKENKNESAKEISSKKYVADNGTDNALFYSENREDFSYVSLKKTFDARKLFESKILEMKSRKPLGIPRKIIEKTLRDFEKNHPETIGNDFKETVFFVLSNPVSFVDAEKTYDANLLACFLDSLFSETGLYFLRIHPTTENTAFFMKGFDRNLKTALEECSKPDFILMSDTNSMTSEEGVLAATLLAGDGPLSRIRGVFVGDSRVPDGPGRIGSALVELDVPSFSLKLPNEYKTDSLGKFRSHIRDGIGLKSSGDGAESCRFHKEMELAMNAFRGNGYSLCLLEPSVASGESYSQAASKAVRVFLAEGTPPNEIAVFSPAGNGTECTENLNKTLRQVLNRWAREPGPLFIESGRPGRRTLWTKGDKVVFELRNDIEDIVPGDTGIVERVVPESGLHILTNSGKNIVVGIDEMDAVSHAFALSPTEPRTGTFSCGVIVLPVSDGASMSLQEFYAGLSKIEKRCFVVGTFDGLEQVLGVGISRVRVDIVCGRREE